MKTDNNRFRTKFSEKHLGVTERLEIKILPDKEGLVLYYLNILNFVTESRKVLGILHTNTTF